MISPTSTPTRTAAESASDATPTPGEVVVEMLTSLVAAPNAAAGSPGSPGGNGSQAHLRPTALGHLGIVVAYQPPCGDLVVGQRAIVRTANVRSTVTVPHSCCVPAPDFSVHPVPNASLAAAAISALALARVQHSGIRLGDAALVVGHDPLALLTLQWAKQQGAVPLLFAAPDGPSTAALLDVARRLGADFAAGLTSGNIPEIVAKAVGQRGLGWIFDTTGDGKALPGLLRLLRRKGRLIVVGQMSGATTSINMYQDLHLRELELCGTPGISEYLSRHDRTGGNAERRDECDDVAIGRHDPDDDLSFARNVRTSLEFIRSGRIQIEPLIGPPLSLCATLQGDVPKVASHPWQARVIDWTCQQP